MSSYTLQRATREPLGRGSITSRAPDDVGGEALGNTRRVSSRGGSSLLLGSMDHHEGLRPSISCSPLGTRGDHHLRRVTRRVLIQSRHKRKEKKRTGRCAVLDATQSARERSTRNSAPEEGRM